MNTIYIWAFLVIFGVVAGTVIDNTDVVTNTTQVVNGEDGTVYHLKVTPTGNKEEVRIEDSEGNILTSVHNYKLEGYLVFKPENQNVCLIEESSDDDSTCYLQTPVTDNLPEAMAEVCRGRERYILKPSACPTKTGDSGPAVKNRGGILEVCLDHPVIQTGCFGEYCCSHVLFWCTNHCCQYNVRVVTVEQCIAGLV
ncbi:uncharacterized protein LOC128203613 [Mya arenaria]|uniref:uncharacterized protein LOC128203613 n=1 Tax=Mya arenaria TaxID=6604 RepID=UPI0022E86411|nr:uncharacterized protein LOC128203613 [Mya arenaria]